MANPRVRPHLHFYPEDSGQILSEARQAAKWLHELPSEDTTPMIRIQNVDYYILEPALLIDGRACIPNRWFSRGERLYAITWPMEQITLDSTDGWCVREDIPFEVSASQLLSHFPRFAKEHLSHKLPHPSRILGKVILLY
jgi:hypothetical protein